MVIGGCFVQHHYAIKVVRARSKSASKHKIMQKAGGQITAPALASNCSPLTADRPLLPFDLDMRPCNGFMDSNPHGQTVRKLADMRDNPYDSSGVS